MTKYRTTFLVALAGLSVASAAAFFATRLSANEDVREADEGRAAVGLITTTSRPLPDYRMINLDGREISADELRHGRVLLVYLTTNCGPCVKEVEVISRLYKDAPADLRIYGVGIERPAQLATFTKEFDLKFPVLVDASAQLARSLDIHHFPSKYLVEDGVITKVWRGKTNDEAALRSQLDR